ncbi:MULTISPECIES: ABC transporter substrate-binding protein [Clostridium]|uniref:ABC transporter substrate-binding protein n=1 Tax=Clostridium TaxID=1485 RepID=UPI00156E3DA3|nr:ABC transporter substrate-binding protein [Clostridium beijerinckii]NRT71447.1 sulfonate transport system substrate-binding protein [Clostridium beijerinckii]
MKKKIFIMLSIIMTLMLMITGCSSQNNKTDSSSGKNDNTKKVVRIACATQNEVITDLGAGRIAQQEKYIEEEFQKIGYDVQYIAFPGVGPAINEAFVAKEIDFAVYGDLPSIVLKSKGIGVSMIAIPNTSQNIDLIVAKDSSINSVEDIKGKKIIVPKGTINQNYFQHLIDSKNIKIDDINIVNAAADAQSTFLSGSVDGLVTNDIVAQKLVLDNSAKIIASTVSKPEWSSQATVVVRDEYAKDNPEVPVAFLKALIRGKNYIKDAKDKDEIYKILDTGMGQEATKKALSYDGGKFDYTSVEINSDSINKLKDLNKFLSDQKLITNNVDIDKFVNTTYYNKAIKELG